MTTNPHDALFKASMTPDAARALCRAVLPSELAAAFASATFESLPTDFIEDSLRELYSDALFEATNSEQPTLVYVLVEHQSSVDPLMPYRVLRYMTKVWDGWLAL